MNIKRQSSKGRRNINVQQHFCSFFDEMNYLRQSGKFHSEEDPSSTDAQGIASIMH